MNLLWINDGRAKRGGKHCLLWPHGHREIGSRVEFKPPKVQALGAVEPPPRPTAARERRPSNSKRNNRSGVVMLANVEASCMSPRVTGAEPTTNKKQFLWPCRRRGTPRGPIKATGTDM